MSAAMKTFWVGLVVAVSVCAGALWTSAQAPVKRTFTILAVEPKGGVTVDKEAFPTSPLPAGGGFVLSPPDAKSQRWEVSAYVWQPSQIIVNQGDEVTLDFVGINGAAHATTIAAFGQTFIVKRGQSTRVTFFADKPGIHGIVCSQHQPSMTGELIVLAK